jgi:hypothetical protein
MKHGECPIERLPRIAKASIDLDILAQGGRSVSFAPLFDTCMSFRDQQSVRLRFRARDALSGIPIRWRDISFFLRREADGLRRVLPVKAVKKGVFEVPFRPEGPGQYWIDASVRGLLAGSLPAVQLGVVGFVRSLAHRRALPSPTVPVSHRRT